MSAIIAQSAPPDVTELRTRVSLAAVIAETLPLRRAGRFLVALCPFHGERTPSFTVFADHFHCFGCGAHGDVFTWLMQARGMTFLEALAHLGGTGDRLHSQATRPAPAPTLARGRADAADARRNAELARRIWCEAQDPRGTPVEMYLQHRGVTLPDLPVVRWHPNCPRTGGALPAMVALMTDPETNEPTGIHRTFLQPDGAGKASLDRPKMMLGRAGVIRLAVAEGVGLGLAEGIETSLSVMQVFGWRPVWAAGSRGGIATFPVLPACTLTIFADNDLPGLKAARACAARWAAAGHEADILAAPPQRDFNDLGLRAA